MKTIKVSEATGPALDWLVAKCEYDELAALNIQYPDRAKHYPKVSPSTDWSQGGPIIEREGVCLRQGHTGWWIAYKLNLNDEETHMQVGAKALAVAMRCFVISRLGHTAEVPEELL